MSLKGAAGSGSCLLLGFPWFIQVAATISMASVGLFRVYMGLVCTFGGFGAPLG